MSSLNSAKNVLGKDKVCRDYVWGKCIRKRCNLPHVCDIQTMVDILQFCHDYQNSTGCKRQNCTFLHATREEEKLFRDSGQFPSDLMKRHNNMNLSRDDSYANQPPPLPNQGPPQPSKQGPPAPSQQGPPPRPQAPPMIMVNPAYQSPWFLLPPPPPPREPSPPLQTYPGPAVNTSVTSQLYTTRIDTSKPPPPLAQQVKNGPIRRIPEEEGLHSKARPSQTTYQPTPTRQIPEMLTLDIDTTKPPPRLTTVKTSNEKRTLSEPYVGPSKTRKIETESTTCENCLHWDLRNLEIEKKKKDKLKEKGILVLRYEEKKKEFANIVDTLKGLNNDSSNNEPYDLASIDLQYVLNDPDILPLQRMRNLDGLDFLSNSHIPKPHIRNGQGSTTNGLTTAAGEAPRSFPSTSAVPTQPHPPVPPQCSVSTTSSSSVVTAYTHPPPVRQHFPMGQSYRPVNNQFNPYLPGPSNGEFSQVNNSAIPSTPVLPPYDQNMYYNMMGRPPPRFT